VVLPENVWSNARETNFSAAGSTKLEQLAQVLSSNPDYRLIIESHTDDKGNADELVGLTEERARIIGDKLASFGVAQSRIETKGYGASIPVAPNTTLANRAKNRRVEITLVLLDTVPADTQAGQ
jgi:outer membrane protein OmpA-like peptidoglycan-associated protein